MQRLSGLLLMLGGACVGAYGYLAPTRDSAADLAEVVRISAAPDRIASTENLRSFAPAPSARENSPPSPAPQKPWTTVVTIEGPAPGQLKSSTPGDWQTRAELARDLMRELKRVGCYQGPVTDVWSPAAREAMSAFTDRVNASLPVGQPDYILLTLVQGYRGAACGTGCPAGQISTANGRCVPPAVLAQSDRKSKRIEEQRLAAARLDGDRKWSTKVEVEKDRTAAPASNDAATSALASEPEKLPWLEASASVAESPEPVVRPEPLPGRMSIGGPDVGLPLPPKESVASTEAVATDPVDDDDLTVKPIKKPKRVHRHRERNYAYYDEPPPRWRYREPERGSVHYLMIHPLGLR